MHVLQAMWPHRRHDAVIGAWIGVTVRGVDDSLDNWFIREILVHEHVLVSYLLRRWPHRADVNDLRQDIYVRVYEAAKRSYACCKRASRSGQATQQIASP